ncbi:MAG TPA: AraC family ligand binding domain-containing protein [Bryobacteraceae bacterium]|nr:AraC family ligand binding domain-containing protein [Bryobacteraceae bacterium]
MPQPITIQAIFSAAFFVLALPAQDPKPTCNQCPATYIDKSELDAYVKRAMDNNLVDQQVRSVDLGKSQIGLGVVYRGKLDRPGRNAVAEHDYISELYHVIEGTATLETGPDLVDAKQRPNSMQTVREFNGPGKNAGAIRNGVTYHLKPGDVIIIPAGTGHLFTHIDDHIVYLMVRIDPDKVVPLRDEAASKTYLASPVKRGGDNN